MLSFILWFILGFAFMHGIQAVQSPLSHPIPTPTLPLEGQGEFPQVAEKLQEVEELNP